MENRKSVRREMKIFVDHILGEDEKCLCVTNDMSLGGLQLEGEPGRGWGRPHHVWLQFRLPNAAMTSVRALGELRYERVGANGKRLRGYRFKYMSPRERLMYNEFLNAQV